MNGMASKKLRRAIAARYTEDGLPRDARDWAAQDWRQLHEAMEEVKRRIAERHTNQEPGERT